jgi:LysR family transcriptional regulator of beta-lactamase
VLLRSYRQDEWPRWWAAAGLQSPVLKGMVFDSSVTIASVAARGFGVALLPAVLFQDEIRERRLVRPFKIEVALGDYWITSLHSRQPSAAMLAFKTWLLETIAAQKESSSGQGRNIGYRRSAGTTRNGIIPSTTATSAKAMTGL